MIGEKYKSSEKINDEIISTNLNNLSTKMEIDHKNEIKIRKTNHTKEKLTIKNSTYNICKLLIIIFKYIVNHISYINYHFINKNF